MGTVIREPGDVATCQTRRDPWHSSSRLDSCAKLSGRRHQKAYLPSSGEERTLVTRDTCFLFAISC